MSMGIPVFANRIASKSMDYANGLKDYYVCSDDAIPSAINKVMTSKSRGLVVGQNGRKVVEEYYSENKYKQKLLEILGN
jgi:glycosyltransferase involved in cell wall biosynthesis